MRETLAPSAIPARQGPLRKTYQYGDIGGDPIEGVTSGTALAY
jgi:hypothetical protein